MFYGEYGQNFILKQLVLISFFYHCFVDSRRLGSGKTSILQGILGEMEVVGGEEAFH